MNRRQVARQVADEWSRSGRLAVPPDAQGDDGDDLAFWQEVDRRLAEAAHPLARFSREERLRMVEAKAITPAEFRESFGLPPLPEAEAIEEAAVRPESQWTPEALKALGEAIRPEVHVTVERPTGKIRRGPDGLIEGIE